MRRRGLTLIELLVVVALIGVVIGLTLPAVQAARQTAWRIKCVANLRQIGIALNAYASRDGTFPAALAEPGGIRDAVTFDRQDFSPFARILPELEQVAIFNAINFRGPQGNSAPNHENLTVSAIALEVFVCPSDAPGGVAMHYRANMGVHPESFAPASAAGAFSLHTWIRPQDFRDGLANTAMISERLRGDHDPSKFDSRRDAWYSAYSGGSLTADGAVARCAAVPKAVPAHSSNGGDSWLLWNYNHTTYNHIAGPNAPTADCSATDAYYGDRGVADAGVFTARSFHSGGVNVLTADGAVRAVGSSASLAIWRALGTRAGGELISE